MSTEGVTTDKVLKLTGIAALSLGVNYLVQKLLTKPDVPQQITVNPQRLIQ